MFLSLSFCDGDRRSNDITIRDIIGWITFVVAPIAHGTRTRGNPAAAMLIISNTLDKFTFPRHARPDCSVCSPARENFGSKYGSLAGAARPTRSCAPQISCCVSQFDGFGLVNS